MRKDDDNDGDIKTVFLRYGDSHIKDKTVRQHLYIERIATTTTKTEYG